MRAAGAAVAVALIGTAPPATAQAAIAVDLPAGRVGAQVLALGSLGRVSITVRDRRLWNRVVPVLRARLTVRAALDRIAAAAGAEVVALGPGGFRLVPRRVARPRPPPPAPGPAPRRHEAGPDIVVTASKRGVSRRDFAGQASWVSGDELALGGAGGTGRLVDRLTSIASTYLGAGRNKLFVRGIADSSFTGATQPTVGQYFGDLRLNYTGADPDLRLIDMAGVEVLEGPQGTLYGAGSLGGLIRLVPNMPDLNRVAGSVAVGGSATRGGSPGTDAQGVVNLPLAPGRAALRVAMIADHEGGYIDKPLLGIRDGNRTRTIGGRATMRVELGGGWSADLTGMGQRIRSDDSQYTDRETRRLTRASPVAEPSSADFAQGQLAVGGVLGGVRVQSTIGATANDLAERYDATAPDGPPRVFVQANRTRMVASETRAWRQGAGGAGWLAGLSYIRNDARTDRLFGAPAAPVPTIGAHNRATELTLYGEASRRPLPGVLATIGARVSHVRLDGSVRGEREADDPDAPTPAVGAASDIARLRSTQTIVLPSASVLLDVGASARAFVRYQPGFRPGGVAVADDALRRFRRDRVDTLEAGFRTTPAGPLRTQVEATLAYTLWTDIQADFLDRRGLAGTANIGDGQILTFEASGSVQPARGLRLTAALSYNDSSIGTSPGGRRGLVLADEAVRPDDAFARLQRIPNVAPLTMRLGGVFERDLDARHTLRVDGWTRYVGPSSLGVGPVLGSPQGDYIDSALTARIGRGGWGVTLGMTNVADARGNRFALGTPVPTGRLQATPLRPRTLRLGLDGAF